MKAFYYSPTGDFSSVTRSSASTWPAFVSLHLESPIRLAISRARYRTLDKAAKSRAKRGPYFVPASFTLATSQRRLELARNAVLVCLDVDDSSLARSLLERLELAGDPAALLPWPFAIYHTASSTTEEPRVRVVVPADELPLPKYGAAVKAVADALGMPHVTRESTVVVQAMFCPTVFSDDAADYSPMVARVLSGPPIRTSDCSEPGADTPPHQLPSVEQLGDEGGAAALEFLRAPVEGVTLKDTQELLAVLDPDLPRDEWLRVMMALQHQFGASEEALEVFDTWSAEGDKYPGHDEILATWRSRAPHARGRLSFTYRSLLKMAQEKGYSSAELETRAVQNLQEWILDKARTVTELSKTAPQKIATLPNLDEIAEQILVSALVTALARRKISAPRASVKKTVAKIRRTIHAPAGKGVAAPPKWALGFCYVAAQEVFFNRATQVKLRRAGVDDILGREFTPPDESEPAERPSSYLLNRLQVPVVSDFIYLPQSSEPYPTHPTRPQLGRFVNTYRPDYPDADCDKADEAGAVLMRHLEVLVREEDYRLHILDWFAYLVQHPGAKIRHALLLQGAEGCGKSALVEMMRAVLGGSNVKSITGSTIVESRFTGWQAGAQLVAIEEVRVSGHNRVDAMNRLKPAITNDMVSIEDKHVDVRETINTANYILLTNQHDALAVNDGDRRYFVVESALQSKDDVRKLPPTHFSDFFDMLRENAAGLRAFFECYEIRPSFNADGHAPVTHYLSRLQRVVESPIGAALRERIEDAEDTLMTPELCTIDAARLALPENLRRDVTDQKLAVVLAGMGYENAGRLRGPGGVRHSVWLRRGTPPDEARGLLTLALELRDAEAV